MKKLPIFVGCLAILATMLFLVQNIGQGKQSTFVDRGITGTDSSITSDADSVNINSQDDSDMRDAGTFISQQQSSQSSQSSGSSYQKSSSSVSLRALDVRQPHILKIESSSGTQFVGKVTINGKVVKKLDSKTFQINLSPYLSVGEHKVEISGRYPASSSIKVELKGPGTNVTQQSSGNGVLNHTMNVTVQ